MLAYNCSPSFNWKKNLDDATVAKFQRELGAMGYKFQFITLAGFHSLNYSMFNLAHGYAHKHMTAFVELQEAEFAAVSKGFTAIKHQREVGTELLRRGDADRPGQPGVDHGAQGLDRGRAVLRQAEDRAARRQRLSATLAGLRGQMVETPRGPARRFLCPCYAADRISVHSRAACEPSRPRAVGTA